MHGVRALAALSGEVDARSALVAAGAVGYLIAARRSSATETLTSMYAGAALSSLREDAAALHLQVRRRHASRIGSFRCIRRTYELCAALRWRGDHATCPRHTHPSRCPTVSHYTIRFAHRPSHTIPGSTAHASPNCPSLHSGPTARGQSCSGGHRSSASGCKQRHALVARTWQSCSGCGGAMETAGRLWAEELIRCASLCESARHTL